MDSTRNDYQLRSYLDSPITNFTQDDYINPQRDAQQSMSGSQELVEFGISADESLEFVKVKHEKERLIELIQRHAEILLETIVRSMIHELMTSKALRERIRIKPEEISTIEPKELILRLDEFVKNERQLEEEFPEFLKSLEHDSITDDFIWCEVDKDLKPILSDLIDVIKASYKKAETDYEEVDLDKIMKAQFELEKLDLEKKERTLVKNLIWIGFEGIKQTGNVIIFSKEVLKVSIEAFKILCSTATLLGVTALVVQSPYLPIMEILFRFAFTKLL